MPETTTPHFAIPYPKPVGGVKLGAADFEELAIKVDELLFAAQQAQFATGDIKASAVAAAPVGWLLCQGQEVSRTGATLALFNAIGTAFGVGNGTTTFNVPDGRERVLMGAGLGSGGSGGSGPALGSKGGEWTHKLTEAELASHAHGVTDPGHKHPMAKEDNSGAQISYVSGGNGGQTGSLGHEGYNNGFVVTQIAGTGVSVNSAGGGTAHANVQPFTAINYMIKT